MICHNWRQLRIQPPPSAYSSRLAVALDRLVIVGAQLLFSFPQGAAPPRRLCHFPEAAWEERGWQSTKGSINQRFNQPKVENQAEADGSKTTCAHSPAFTLGWVFSFPSVFELPQSVQRCREFRLRPSLTPIRRLKLGIVKFSGAKAGFACACYLITTLPAP